MKVLTRKGLAANGSITSTSVLVYMALHDDDTLRFSGKRMDRITDWVVQRSAFINHDPGKLIACQEQITWQRSCRLHPLKSRCRHARRLACPKASLPRIPV